MHARCSVGTSRTHNMHPGAPSRPAGLCIRTLCSMSESSPSASATQVIMPSSTSNCRACQQGNCMYVGCISTQSASSALPSAWSPTRSLTCDVYRRANGMVVLLQAQFTPQASQQQHMTPSGCTHDYDPPQQQLQKADVGPRHPMGDPAPAAAPKPLSRQLLLS